jgi:cyanate lyase
MNIFLQAKKAQGMTYQAMSSITGIDQACIHNMLIGSRSFRQAHMVKITLCLGLDPDQAIKAWTEMEKKRLNINLERDCEHLRQMFAEARKKETTK